MLFWRRFEGIGSAWGGQGDCCKEVWRGLLCLHLFLKFVGVVLLLRMMDGVCVVEERIEHAKTKKVAKKFHLFSPWIFR